MTMRRDALVGVDLDDAEYLGVEFVGLLVGTMTIGRD